MSDWSSQRDAYLRLERDEHFLTQAEQLEPEQSMKVFGQPRLKFGTAGIRGPMGPGFSQMNDLVVIQTSQGLVSYLLEEYGESLCKKRGVIIGHDARHNSSRFARLAALAFLQKSIPVYFSDQIIPTPLIAHGVTYFNCYCGIVITASHNPKHDNGYKVYWANGAQILSPHDRNIQAHIMREENLQPWDRQLSWAHESLLPAATDGSAPARTKLPDEMSCNLFRIYDELCKSYFAYVQRLVAELQPQNRLTAARITYTTMHGVGHEFLTRALNIAGFQHCHPVEAQAKPDPEFPTVKFPNPEEAGAMDLAFETAARTGSSLILANDPDADRCAAALFCPATGKRRVLSGNEIGSLLGWWAWHRHQTTTQSQGATMTRSSMGAERGRATSGRGAESPMARDYPDDFDDLDNDDAEISTDKTPATPIGKPPVSAGGALLSAPPKSGGSKRAPARVAQVAQKAADCYMLSTAVSSRFIQSMARVEGFQYIETLTGFKYMGNLAHDLLKRGKTVLFAYEEAIGFMVDAQILDKDGISAAVQLAQCAAHLLATERRTLEAQLDWLYARYGYHFSLNSYFLCHEPRTIRAIFHQLQSNYPKSFKSSADEEFEVTRIRDLNNGVDNGTPDHKPDLPVSSSSFMVTFFVADEIRFTIRTSGTEPKIKYYSEIVAPLRGDDDEQAAAKVAAQSRLRRFLGAAVERCLKPDFYRLEPASG